MDLVDRYCGVALVQLYQVVQHAPDTTEVRLMLARIIQESLD
ncbi:hypothetical protein [Aquipseudomonas campi]|nr:hypothetical protein [Pseudomonas campi]